jgi:hypothetical protein
MEERPFRSALNEAEWAPRKALKILRAFTTTVCQSTNV